MSSEAVLSSTNDQLARVNQENGEVKLNSSVVTIQESGDTMKQVEVPGTNKELDIFQEAKTINEIKDDMIPEELLYSLTHSEQLLGKKKGAQLGPIKELKTPEKMKMALRKGPPSNVWHHKGRRTHFKHLTENPRSNGQGVGTRDVSFLYDVVHQHEPSPPSLSKLDKSAVRLEALETKPNSKIAVPDSIIPEEYHLVKTKAVLGLEYIDENLTTLATDHEKNLRIFPSLKPNKRFEVLQLLQTLEAMLEESGVRDDAVEVKGPTQIHNLLELIKKEQSIYDLVFSEVIRQVTVECVERGQLLSQLRQNYADLLNRIPRQIQSLHAEVMAQRSLDRRLTEELVRFKSAISFLTKELQSVREHDHQVTVDAQMAEDELSKALKESQTNANLVDEYHNLYELQRRRLEATVVDLTSERDLWSNAAYNLALKISSLNSLSTAKRLHVSEKAWSKLANHFTVMLSDRDSERLTEMQKHVEKWRAIMFHFRQDLEKADKNTTDLLSGIREGLEKWRKKYEDTLIELQGDVRYFKEPPKDFVEGLLEFFKSSENEMGENGERFAGYMLLSNEEKVGMMIRECDAWTEIAWDVYRRHKSDSDEPFSLCEDMKKVNNHFHVLVKQLQIRFSGENGVARGIMNIQNAFEIWINKLTLQSLGSDSLSDTEWMNLFDRMGEYVSMFTDVLSMVGSQQQDEDRVNELPHEHISASDVMKSVHGWMKSTVNEIEAEDGKMMAKVSSIHMDLVRWMVQMLLNLVPDFEQSRHGSAMEPSMATTWTVPELAENAQSVSHHLTDFTDYASKCCSQIVQETMQEKRDRGDDDAENDYTDFLRLKLEASEWIRNAEYLLNAIVPNAISLLDAETTSKLQLPGEEKTKSFAALKDSQRRQSKPHATKDAEGVASLDDLPEGQPSRTGQPSQQTADYDVTARARRTSKGLPGESSAPSTPGRVDAVADSRAPKEQTIQQPVSTTQGGVSSAIDGPSSQENLEKKVSQETEKESPVDATKRSLNSQKSGAEVTEQAQASSTAAEDDMTPVKPDSSDKKSTKPGTPGSKLSGKQSESEDETVAMDEDSAREKALDDESATPELETASKSKVQGGKPPQKQAPAKKSKAKDGKAKKLSTKLSKGGAKQTSIVEEADATDSVEEEQAQTEEEDEPEEGEVQRELQQELREKLAAVQKSFTEAKPGVTQYQCLGEDENIHLATLEDPDNPLNPDSLLHPTSSLMQQAYDAIAKMDTIQNELLTTEIRAQNAEKSLIELQEELNAANQRIRGLEKTIKSADGQAFPSPSPSDRGASPDESKLQDASADKQDSSSAKGPKSQSVDSAKRRGAKASPKPKKPAGSKKK